MCSVNCVQLIIAVVSPRNISACVCVCVCVCCGAVYFLPCALKWN